MGIKLDISLAKCILLIGALGVFIASLQASTVTFEVDLYGHPLHFQLSDNFYHQRATCFSEDGLSEAVEKLVADPETSKLVEQLDIYAREYRLDDMAYLMMLNKVTNTLMRSESDACKTLFKYALLHKKDFDVFLGFTEHSLTLYGRTNVMIDNCIFIERGPKKYFDLSFSQRTEPKTEQLFVLRHQSKALPLVMNMIEPPALWAHQTKKVFPFEYDGYLYFFKANVNQSLVEYYRDLPTININTVYLNYGLSSGVMQSLVSEMRQATASMKKTDAVQFMLQFVQSAFEYRKDEQVYGEEKFAFPEETLLNDYADCEDKAMLFAYLVNKVSGLKTVALFYKDAKHINVGIENWNAKTASSFVFNDKGYIVCEPSGKGFTPGESATAVGYASLIEW